MLNPRTRTLLRNLGPGLLYAAAAIGVSHLVQSTRAGAEYGFIMVLIVVLANLLKYPFFEYGPRYAAATGEDLITGYQRLGNWALAVFLIMTFGTIFVIQAAVTVVTAGLAGQLTGIELSPWAWSSIILLICSVILLIGHYKALDRSIKGIMVVLAITTLVAVIAAFFADVPKDPKVMQQLQLGKKEDLFFLVALIGWMPAPFDISVWHSVWSVAKKKEYNENGLREAMMDFRIGYWGTAFLAVCFVSLGSLIIYGTGQGMPSSGVAFSGELIELYTDSLGSWSYWVIGIAAFTTMFSTTLTVLDAYPRVLGPTTARITGITKEESRKNYSFWLLFTIAGTMIILIFFLKSMTALIDLVTTISFILAPLFAIMNYLVIMGHNVPKEARPGLMTHIISWLGIAFSLLLAAYYLFAQYFA